MNYNPLVLHHFSHRAMNCDWGISLAGIDAPEAEGAANAAFEEVDRLERQLSRFIPGSEVWQINHAGLDESVPIGMDLIECLQIARSVWEETGGAFDPALGHLRSDRAFERGQTVVLAGRCFEHIRVDRATKLVSRLAPVELDLGAIGKGYAVDQAAALLQRWGMTDFMIHSAQSTALAVGEYSPGQPWMADLRDPADGSRALASIPLNQRALSGSGTAIKGEHIFDPRTARPATTHRLATWAACPRAAQSDALSTALMVMELAEIEAYARRHPQQGLALLLPEGLWQRGLW